MPVNGQRLNWNVLIIDDDTDHLDVTAEFLEFKGAMVEVASNGAQGLAKLKTYLPNIILLDLSMPDMDGWTMLEKVRQNPRTANIPVIALTAHAMPEDQRRVMEAGFDGYLSKPFILDKLVEQMKKWVNEGIKR